MADSEAPLKKPLVPNAVHLVRTAQQMNLQLSQMADQKASMLMGATFVVFTLAVGQLSKGDGGAMAIPIAILAVAAFLSAVFAVMAVLPKVTRPNGPLADDANILFFGNFTSIGEKEFADRIVAQLSDDEDVYRVMLRDMYQNGCVLQHKKYRYLAIAYRTFLIGLGISFVAFVAHFAMHWPRG